MVSDTTFAAKNQGYYYQFNTDGTANINKGYGTVLNGFFIITGTNISIVTPPVTANSTGGTYVVTGLSETGDIKSLEANEMVLNFYTYDSNPNVVMATGIAKVTEKIYLYK